MVAEAAAESRFFLLLRGFAVCCAAASAAAASASSLARASAAASARPCTLAWNDALVGAAYDGAFVLALGPDPARLEEERGGPRREFGSRPAPFSARLIAATWAPKSRKAALGSGGWLRPLPERRCDVLPGRAAEGSEDAANEAEGRGKEERGRICSASADAAYGSAAAAGGLECGSAAAAAEVGVELGVDTAALALAALRALRSERNDRRQSESTLLAAAAGGTGMGGTAAAAEVEADAEAARSAVTVFAAVASVLCVAAFAATCGGGGGMVMVAWAADRKEGRGGGAMAATVLIFSLCNTSIGAQSRVSTHDIRACTQLCSILPLTRFELTCCRLASGTAAVSPVVACVRPAMCASCASNSSGVLIAVNSNEQRVGCC